jgi:hypothetical protein
MAWACKKMAAFVAEAKFGASSSDPVPAARNTKYEKTKSQVTVIYAC